MTRNSLWIQRRRKDQYYRLAKDRGYRSRAAFKLSQMIESYRFIQRGDRVIELGAAPGGWTQVVAKTVGTEGFVLGVDIKPIEPLDQSQVGFLKLDITSDSIIETLTEKFTNKVDAIISDVSPNVSGAWDVDHSRQIYLAQKSLELARTLLKAKGNFLVKIFQGSETDQFLKEIRENFHIVRIIRPRATRTSSSEIYVLGLGFLNRPRSQMEPTDPNSLS